MTHTFSDSALQKMAELWKTGGCNAIAQFLHCSQVAASRTVSNARRTHPDLFPRKRPGSIRRQWRISQAIQYLEQGLPELALAILKTLPKGKQ